MSKKIKLPGAARIVEFILKYEPCLGQQHTNTHSIFDVLKDEPADKLFDADDWARIADVDLDARFEENLPGERAFIYRAMEVMRSDKTVRLQVGEIMRGMAEEIRAANCD